jgi:signal transduction histidine kinase
MKLQLRFFIVLLVIFAAMSSFLVLQREFKVERSRSVLSSELDQRRSYFTNVVNLDGQSEKQLSEDYSFWDDMVSFVKTDDITFAQQNLDTGLVTFNVDADWVYRPNGTLLYFSSLDGSSALKSIQLTPAFFRQLTKYKLEHFYLPSSQGILEIRAATIVPSSDPEHHTPEQGFWIVGRLLDKAYASNLESLTNTNVSIQPGSANKATRTTNNSVSFDVPLRNWNGTTIGGMRSTSTVSVISNLDQQYRRELELLIVFTGVLAVIIITSVWLLVLKPLGLITQALNEEDTHYVSRLRKKKTEFGSLAQTVTDFFEQKVVLAEAQFRKTELEKLNKEKSSFLAVAAHELNGPVSNVKIFSEYLAFLLTKGQDRDETQITQQVKRIEHQTIKINMLLSDLRAVSEGKQGFQFNLRDFDFDAFLKEEVDEASFSTKQTITLSGTTSQTLHSDPDRLGQVISNLIRNASKYSPDADEIKINVMHDQGQIIFSVQDFGIGISDEDKQKIFEPFFRSEEVTKSFPGLGLGLYISKQIIEGLGGTMQVESTPGHGSTFTVSIPLLQHKSSQVPNEMPSK